MIRACALLLLAGCTVPELHSGNLQCASGGRCPGGFHCATDDRCWKNGSDPEAGADLSVPDAAMAGDLGTPPDLLLHPDLAKSTDMTATPSKCAASTALLCDGFEAAALDPEWSTTSTNGTLEIDTTRAFRGARSLHLHTGQVPDGGAGVEATINESRTFPQNGATIYLRVWAYIQSPYPASGFDQFINFLDNGTTGIAYVLFNGFPLLNAYTIPNVFKQGTMPAIPLDRWTCLQMSMPQTGSSGTVSLSVDGVSSDASSGGVATTAMRAVFIGPQFNGGGPGFGPADIWIDELLIDNKVVACDQ